MKLALLTSNTFSIFGGFERVVKTVFDSLIDNYGYEITTICISPYRTLLSEPIFEDSKVSCK